MVKLLGVSSGKRWREQSDEVTGDKRFAMYLLVIIGFLETVGCIQLLSNLAIGFLQSMFYCCGILADMRLFNFSAIYKVNGQPCLTPKHQEKKGVYPVLA